MKYVKILGLLAVAAAALMAFAATASATLLTSPTGVPYTGPIASESEEAAVPGTKHVRLQNPIASIACNSKVAGKEVEQHGTGLTVKGKITTLEWPNCTNSWHVTTIAPGTLEVHYKAPGEGTLTSTGATIDTTRFGVTCTYATNNTHIGTITDSHKTGHHATLHIEAQIPLHNESSGLCGSGSAKWEGAYTVTTPTLLYIDP